MNCPCDPIGSTGRNLCIHKVVRKSQRNAKNQKHSSHQQTALGHDPWNVLEQVEIFVDKNFYNKGVKCGQSGCFNRRGKSTEESPESDHR